MSYVEFTAEDSVDGWTAILPNATSNFVLTLCDGIQLDNSTEKSALYACCTSTVALKPFVGLSFVSVQLNHYGLYILSGIPASELSNTLLTFDCLFDSSELSILTEKLHSARSTLQMFSVLEQFFLARVNTNKLDVRLPFVTSLIKAEPNIRLDEISQKVSLSNRGLQKLFQKHTGMNPSYFKKIVRFNHAANSLLHASSARLSDVAADCGYFDQAHFIKDFKHFARISPSNFQKLKARSSDFYNYNLKDLVSLTSS